jgi:hypothetical protein
MYDFKKKESVPLDKCVERNLMTQEEYEEAVRDNAKSDAYAREHHGGETPQIRTDARRRRHPRRRCRWQRSVGSRPPRLRAIKTELARRR